MTRSIVFVLTLVFFVGNASNAYTQIPNCISRLVSKSGTVKPGEKIIVNTFSPSEFLIIEMKKTGGMAGAKVELFIDGRVYGQIFSFGKGKDVRLKKRSFSRGTQYLNKSVRIEITNIATTGDFKFNIDVKSRASALLGSGSGSPLPQAQKKVVFDRTCNNQISIKVVRTNGNARAEVKMYKGNTEIWNGILGKDDMQVSQTFRGLGDGVYSVSVKNISVGNKIKFEASAAQSFRQ